MGEKQGGGEGAKGGKIKKSRPKKKGANKRERDDLIIGQACTLTNFRESVVKGAEKPESLSEGEEEKEGTWKKRGRERDGPRVNLDGRLLAEKLLKAPKESEFSNFPLVNQVNRFLKFINFARLYEKNTLTIHNLFI